MKVLILLALVALASARPQFLPYTAPLVVKTAAGSPSLTSYTAAYPYTGLPFAARGFPFTAGTYTPKTYGADIYTPLTYSAGIFKGVGDKRTKRSADADADPQLVFTTGIPQVYSSGIPQVYSNIPKVYSSGIPQVYSAGIPQVYSNIPKVYSSGIPQVYTAGIPQVYSTGIPQIYSKTGTPQVYTATPTGATNIPFAGYSFPYTYSVPTISSPSPTTSFVAPYSSGFPLVTPIVTPVKVKTEVKDN
ncbi:uncharacterized protein [Procambarus clarkii]|uniref:uncharacterized protein n=1 Tax=Procambarus clarkii TaxID=6728 RepID=UPI001E67494B|nr:uncharacterized protein LOC123768786 [Procambarus clarkii]